MNNKRLVRFKGLRERGVVNSWTSLKHLQNNEGFPAGFLLGPSTRVWFEDDIDTWLASRPSEQSHQTKERAAKAAAAKREAAHAAANAAMKAEALK